MIVPTPIPQPPATATSQPTTTPQPTPTHLPADARLLRLRLADPNCIFTGDGDCHAAESAVGGVHARAKYPGSEIVIEQKLAAGSNYQRYLASYRSEGLKIYALLTVPNGHKPATGWPVIVFNHGYIPPERVPYDRALRRATSMAFARNGYIVFEVRLSRP